jgi:hypothetical protein
MVSKRARMGSQAFIQERWMAGWMLPEGVPLLWEGVLE